MIKAGDAHDNRIGALIRTVIIGWIAAWKGGDERLPGSVQSAPRDA
jgi:hypothetical protein